jgi:hypothetical protein
MKLPKYDIDTIVYFLGADKIYKGIVEDIKIEIYKSHIYRNLYQYKITWDNQIPPFIEYKQFINQDYLYASVNEILNILNIFDKKD